MTEDEAREETDINNKKFGFCPVINNKCKQDECVCYMKGVARKYAPAYYAKDKEAKWYPGAPSCNHLMISSVILIES